MLLTRKSEAIILGTSQVFSVIGENDDIMYAEKNMLRPACNGLLIRKYFLNL
jgi:hypothetical protein